MRRRIERPAGRHYARGAQSVEFSLLLLGLMLPVTWVIFEFASLTLQDQLVNRAAHNAAQAAGRDPLNCDIAVNQELNPDPGGTRRVYSWLLDDNNNGTIAGDELQVAINSDNGDLSDGVDFNRPGCGTPGSWIEVRATVTRSISGINVVREYTGWSMHEP